MSKKKISKKEQIIPLETNITKPNLAKRDSFYFWDGDILVLNVLGTPSAKEDVIGKVKGNQLRISVTEAPRRGKATDHMVRFLAKIFEVSVLDIEVVFGRMNINKQLRIKSPKNLPSVFTSTE